MRPYATKLATGRHTSGQRADSSHQASRRLGQGHDPRMSEAPDELTYALELAVTDWLSISGDVMEEELRLTQYAYDIGDDEEVETNEEGVIREVADLMALGRSIGDVGRRQLPDWPSTFEGMQTWPAPERTEVFALTARQWGMAIHGLEEWAAVSERVGHTESAANRRQLAVHLRNELAARGLSHVPDPLANWRY